MRPLDGATLSAGDVAVMPLTPVESLVIRNTELLASSRR